MPDWATELGPATEPNFDRFVRSVGGARVDERFGLLVGESADYVFEERKVLVEFKVIETEFGDTKAFARKERDLQRATAKRYSLGEILRGEPGPTLYYREHEIEFYRAPLSRIAKKANRQLRSTKASLGLDSYRGILMCVNNQLRRLTVQTALDLFSRILNGDNSQVDGLIYLTNHYVDILDIPYANRVWVPLYRDSGKDDLPKFVNWLGKSWFDFCDAEFGPAGNRVEGPNIDISGARPIRRTSSPGEGPDFNGDASMT